MNKALKHPTAYLIFHWTPKVLSIIFSLLVSLYAFDAIRQEHSLACNILSVLLHMIPGFIVAGLSIIAWWKPFLGGTLFMLLGVLYAFASIEHLQWVLVISIPLFVLGALFVVAYIMTKKVVREQES